MFLKGGSTFNQDITKDTMLGIDIMKHTQNKNTRYHSIAHQIPVKSF